MYFAYFDESGDSGYENSPTNTFTLAAVLVHDNDWMATLDEMVSFRRYVRDQFGVPPRAEIKANWLIHKKGPCFKNLDLSFPGRLNLYEAFMRFQRKVGMIQTFAIVIDKDKVYKTSVSPRDYAWTRAIERLERFGSGEGETLHVLPDEGHGHFIQKKIRAMRRFHKVDSAFDAKTLDRRAENIIGDSSDRSSEESYFIQLADLNAYAAYRRVYPGSNFDESYWKELGDARVNEVNRLSGGPTGIVLWPQD